MKALFTYITSRIFLKNLLYAIGIVIVFIIFTFSCMRIYTNHGRASAVPEFIDMTLDEAVPVIEEKKLRYEVFDSLYSADKEPGVIIEQHPKAGLLVKKNRKIFFTVNASGPEKIVMPNLVGITFREGSARIQSNGLLLGDVSYRYDISKNVILEQLIDGKEISHGDSVTKGTRIDLVLGKGLGNKKSMVPDLIGLTVDEAKAKVAGRMFSIGAIVPDATVDEENDTTNAFIFRQRPESNPEILVPLGSSISLWISNDTTKLPQNDMIHSDDEIIDWPD